MLFFTHPIVYGTNIALTQNYIHVHDRISNCVFNIVTVVHTVTDDMIYHHYGALVKVQLKPKRCVRKHFEQFSFSLRTYVFSLFMSVIRLQILQNVIDIARDGYNQWIIHIRYFLPVGTVILFSRIGRRYRNEKSSSGVIIILKNVNHV